MNIYLTIMVTVLVVTQIIRVIQNHIQLCRQYRLLKKQLAQIDDVTQDDLDTQRKAYKLIVKHYEAKEENRS